MPPTLALPFTFFCLVLWSTLTQSFCIPLPHVSDLFVSAPTPSEGYSFNAYHFRVLASDLLTQPPLLEQRHLLILSPSFSSQTVAILPFSTSVLPGFLFGDSGMGLKGWRGSPCSNLVLTDHCFLSQEPWLRALGPSQTHVRTPPGSPPSTTLVSLERPAPAASAAMGDPAAPREDLQNP